ncbi:hypothetical protein [Arthrobacter mobilis]|uniref:Uncharacterized protein n=1 Tax=Arthrobacter mobilis TaxID=2724944 RepID=A0A7X6HH10_9MICC|nr:hypothetical protein [Arthrobacter mobilis]NKX55998.1 hypothetical protein [Arthrobacter mobilis]
MDSVTDRQVYRRSMAWPVFDFIDSELPQEIVTLTSVSTRDGFEATAVRSWVSDIDGTGLEADQTDPVLILSLPRRPGMGLARFHLLAVAELHRRRGFDYEVADLFLQDIPEQDRDGHGV